MAKYAVCGNCGTHIKYGKMILSEICEDKAYCCEECFIEDHYGEYLYPADDDDYDMFFDHDDDE